MEISLVAIEILEEIQKKPRITPIEVAEKIQLAPQYIRNVLRVLSELLLVETPVRGVYVITDLGKSVLKVEEIVQYMKQNPQAIIQETLIERFCKEKNSTKAEVKERLELAKCTGDIFVKPVLGQTWVIYKELPVNDDVIRELLSDKQFVVEFESKADRIIRIPT